MLKVETFQDEDIFLSACLSGDLEEVQTLLSDGADINTTTVDGLTALHQVVLLCNFSIAGNLLSLKL